MTAMTRKSRKRRIAVPAARQTIATTREKRNKVVSGKAVVHLDYTAPQSGQELSGGMSFDGGDDQFYS